MADIMTEKYCPFWYLCHQGNKDAVEACEVLNLTTSVAQTIAPHANSYLDPIKSHAVYAQAALSMAKENRCDDETFFIDHSGAILNIAFDLRPDRDKACGDESTYEP